jgi:hypothetical protein
MTPAMSTCASPWTVPAPVRTFALYVAMSAEIGAVKPLSAR